MSLAAARDDYGVVLVPAESADSVTLDEAATVPLRARAEGAAHGTAPMIDRGEGYEKMLRGEVRAADAFEPDGKQDSRGTSGMAIEVAKIELKTVQDASGLEACIAAGQFTADEVIAVIGKTEGNGGVNDFTRILADQAFRRVLLQDAARAAKRKSPTSRWCGRAVATASSRRMPRSSPATPRPARPRNRAWPSAPRMSAELMPEDIGRPAMVEKVAEGVKAAMRDAGIDDPKDVHYVQTKTPLLTIETVRDAESRGQHVACEVHDSMGVSNGTTALGIARGARRDQDAEARSRSAADLDLYSSVASCSSGVELTQAQIVLLGNKAGRRRPLSHRPCRDAAMRSTSTASTTAIRDAGLELPDAPARRGSRAGGWSTAS